MLSTVPPYIFRPSYGPVNSTMYCLLSHFPSLMFAGNEDPLEEETQEERRYFR